MNYYQGAELCSYRTGFNMNKRLIVLTKKIWKNNKICCDKLLYSHNTSDINDDELYYKYFFLPVHLKLYIGLKITQIITRPMAFAIY